VESSTPENFDALTKDPYKENLYGLANEIKELTDDNAQNDIIGESVMVNDQLNNSLQEYLKNNKNVTDLIKGELNRIINDSNISQEAKDSANTLLRLIESINPAGETPITLETAEQSEEPKLDLKWELWEITPLSGWENTKWKFYDKLVEHKPDGDGNEQNDTLNLRKTKETLDEQLTKINELLNKNSDLSNNEDFAKTKRLIEGVWWVIKNPVESNVVRLQEFISENLKWTTDWDRFDATSKRKSDLKFDWKFWVGTLAWLNKVLERTWKYINEISTKFDNPDTQEMIPESLKEVKPKAEQIKIKKGWKIEYKDWLDWLPDWADVTLKDCELETNKTIPQTLILLVKLWNDTREIPVEVIVVENFDSDDSQGQSQETTSQKPQETIPLQDSDGTKHLVMSNSNELASGCGLESVVFYSSLADQSETTEDAESDKVYLMEMWENVYRVKLDSDWKLCPLAENYNSWVKVLFKNIDSCKQYLQNKIPNGINAKIDWNPDNQDYIISSYWMSLTIEPMTMDGKWVSQNLSDCLTLLNFTNYLRGAGKIDDINFKNDNPDLKLDDDGKLYVRVNKKDKWWKDGKWGKWYPVPVERFWLPNNTGVLNKFIKYNNGEHWEDNWDKKDENEVYKKIDLVNGQVMSSNAPTAQPSNAPTAQPSNAPTAQPSTAPTAQPSTTPTAQPDDNPDIVDVNDGGQTNVSVERISLPVEQTDSSGRKYIDINWKVIYQHNQGESWLWYYKFDSWNMYYWNWENDKKVWEWTFIWANWDVYEWSYVDNKRDWKWKYTWVNWDVYEWDFVDGKRTWKWKFTWANW